MEKIEIWAPLMFGAMIGWLSVYFIRKYKKHDSSALLKTAGMFLTGVGLDSLGFIISLKSGVYCILYYMFGCSIGFFVHWIYQFIISLITRKDLSLKNYLLLSSCNLSEEEELRLMEEMGKMNNTKLSEPSNDSIQKSSM